MLPTAPKEETKPFNDINDGFPEKNKKDDKISLDFKPLADIIKNNESKDSIDSKISSLGANGGVGGSSIPTPLDRANEVREDGETDSFRKKIISLLSSINNNTKNQATNNGISKPETKSDGKPSLIDSAKGMLSEYFGNKVNKIKQKVLQKVIPKSIQERIARSNLSSAESMRNHLGLERREPLPTPERRPGLIRRLFSRTPRVDPITTRLDMNDNHPDHSPPSKRPGLIRRLFSRTPRVNPITTRLDMNDNHPDYDRNRVTPDHPDYDRNRVTPDHPDYDRNRVTPDHPDYDRNRVTPDHSPIPERRPGVTRRALNATGRGVKAVGRGVGGIVMGGMSILAPNLLPEAAMDTIDQVSNAADTVGSAADIVRGSRSAGAAADIAGGAARGGGFLSKSMGFLKGAGRVAGKVALPAAVIMSLVEGGMAAMDDESIQKATGKEEVSGTDRISAGAGGIIGGIAGLADMGLGMFGIETNMGESVKQGTTSGLSKAADWSKSKLTDAFESVGNFFGGTTPNITKPDKLDNNGKLIKEPEEKGFFGKMMDWGSEKVSAITKDPISAISSIAPIAAISNLIPDSIKQTGSDLISKGLDVGKNVIQDPISALSKVSTLAPVTMLSNLIPDSVKQTGSDLLSNITKDPIGLISKIAPIAAISNLIPDSVKQTGSDLLSKGLDIGKNALSDPLGSVSKVASLAPLAPLAPVGMLADFMFGQKANASELPFKIEPENNNSLNIISPSNISTPVNSVQGIKDGKMVTSTIPTISSSLVSNTSSNIISPSNTSSNIISPSNTSSNIISPSNTSSNIISPSNTSTPVNSIQGIKDGKMVTMSIPTPQASSSSSIITQSNNKSSSNISSANIISPSNISTPVNSIQGMKDGKLVTMTLAPISSSNTSSNIISPSNISTPVNSIEWSNPKTNSAIPTLLPSSEITRGKSVDINSITNNRQSIIPTIQPPSLNELNKEVNESKSNKAIMNSAPIIVPAPKVVVNVPPSENIIMKKPSLDPSSIRENINGFQFSMV